MEQVLMPRIAAQSCGLKTTISHSKDTGVFIPPQVATLLGLDNGIAEISFN